MKFRRKLKEKLSGDPRYPLKFLAKSCFRRNYGGKNGPINPPKRLSDAFFRLLKRIIEDEGEFNTICEKFQEIFVDRTRLKYKNGNDTFGYRQIIGKGNFGVVYRAHYVEDGKVFDLCVKVIYELMCRQEMTRDIKQILVIFQ